MAIRMLKAGIPTHTHLMAEFVHGFCNMDTNGLGNAEFRRATMLVCDIIKQLFDIQPLR